MSFIAKNPLCIPEITTSPSIPQGTRGLFAKSDGLYELDSEGKESKLATADEVYTKEEIEDEYVKNTDYATSEKAGIVKVASTKSKGIKLDEDNVLQIACAVTNDIKKKVDPYKPIVPRFLEYSVQVCTNQDSEAELTEEQLKLPPSTQYLKNVVGDIETALDNIIAIQNNLMGVSE